MAQSTFITGGALNQDCYLDKETLQFRGPVAGRSGWEFHRGDSVAEIGKMIRGDDTAVDTSEFVGPEKDRDGNPVQPRKGGSAGSSPAK